MANSTLIALTALSCWVFRILATILLKVIPVKQAEWGIPLAFLVYFVLWSFVRPGYTLVEETVTETVKVGLKNKANGKKKANGKPAKDVVVTDEILDVVEVSKVEPSPKSLKRPSLTKIFLGIPTNSTWGNRIPMLFNLALLAMCLDLLFTPFFFQGYEDLTFDRVASVTDSSAKITVRQPPDDDPAATAINYLSYRQARPHAGPWLKGPVLTFDKFDDWVGTFEIDGLLPSTEYEYISPSSPMKVSRWRTAPDPAITKTSGTHYTFLSTSCVKPNFPYSPVGPRNQIRGFKYLSNWLSALPEGKEASFMLFLGDWIYSDTPISGLWKRRTGDWYRRLYRQIYGSQDAKDVFEKLPILHIPDDHEFINNYAGEGQDSHMFLEASSAYRVYNGNGNAKSSFAASSQVLYYDYAYGDTAFFVLDTRQFRSSESMEDGPEKTMLGDVQKDALMHWLGKVNTTSTFKFIVSSVPFNSLWAGPDGQEDTWAGYRTERDEILDVLEYVPNVIILTGDRHEFAAISLRDRVIEFSTSPLSQFYVPYVKTLRQELSRKISVPGEDESMTIEATDEEDTVEELLGKASKNTIYEEKILKYIPEGHSKWSSFEIDTRDRENPFVNVELWVDGTKAWEVKILGEPVIAPAKAMKSGGGLIGILEFLGLSPLKWF